MILAAIAAILAAIAAILAAIAAVSSLRNGREQKRLKNELAKVNGHLEKRNLDDGNTASDPDWYYAPNLWEVERLRRHGK